MTYQTMSLFAQTWGLLLLLLLFLIALGFALWPANKARFDAAARLPLEEAEAINEEQLDVKDRRP